MVSRRRILSRSRDNLADAQYEQEEEEDVWYNMDKLFKDHIQEVLDKWNQIDDEIWAKVIVFERNRRVAKAYARAPVLTVNGSDDGFDGFRIGLCGFDNPMRDARTEEAKKHINQGVKIKMDEQGNILIKRLCKSNVYVKATNQEDNAIGPEIIRNSQGALEHEKPGKLFDMNKFQTNLSRETRRSYPDRRRLETQCLSAVVFVRTEADILQCPVWVLIVNVVGLDMLKSKLPPVLALQRPVDIKNRPRIPIPDEDPYSVATTSSNSEARHEQIYAAYQRQRGESGGQRASAGSSGAAAHRRGAGNGLAAGPNERPPKLPPRENLYGHDIPKPDYDDIEDDYVSSSARAPVVEDKKSKKENNKKYDDPYYCGLRARVPNFVKMAKSLTSNGHSNGHSKLPSGYVQRASQVQPPQPHHHHHHAVYGHGYPISHSQSSQIYGTTQAPMLPNPTKRTSIMYHARSFESGLDSDDRIDSPYNHIYGRLPIPTRGMIPPTPRGMYIGEWD
ncbi:uncharacterized protein LOC131671312 isoform X2 [Phymastichus coffea]|uniref:uncharacterized protein LOC131671312 isoform X2 n=1 Tax=Phymastichus coffea TaxID=108790 RepID=UPI00273CE6AF|nr:uncharacterized protein LOC131671312 isoform X2 [Phymastichus coffea]